MPSNLGKGPPAANDSAESSKGVPLSIRFSASSGVTCLPD